ncbi:MAG: hypothetical protein ACM3XZ_04250 [Betaproteobacteria bacterium]
MKLQNRVDKSLERARSLTLARIVGTKCPRPEQVTVTSEGKVRVEPRRPIAPARLY